MHRTRNLILIAIALVILVVSAVAFGRHGRNDSVAVKTARITLQTFTVKLPETGVVMRPLTATIPTLITGNIASLYAKAGDAVATGQLLATIDNPTLQYNAEGSQADYTSAAANVDAARVQEENAQVSYRAAVETNKSALDEARRVYVADVALFANKAIARNQLDADKSKLDQSQVAYDQAVEQARLGAVSGFNGNSVQYASAAARKSQIINSQNQQQVTFTRIVAPFNGTIQTVAARPNDPLRSLQSGDAVTQGQEIFTIAANGGYVVKAQIDEQDVINVRPGQRVNVSGQDFPGKTIAGHVAHIAPVATKSGDSASTAKQVLATIALDASPYYLKDGMTVDVDILTTFVPGAVVVPNDAVAKEGMRSYVYVVEHNIAKKRTVVVGKASDTQSWIRSGLAPGETIVVAKTPDLADGGRVRPAASPASP